MLTPPLKPALQLRDRAKECEVGNRQVGWGKAKIGVDGVEESDGPNAAAHMASIEHSGTGSHLFLGAATLFRVRGIADLRALPP